jgi:hypothetical protein
MTVLRQAINLTRVTALVSWLEMREDKEAIFNTPATGWRIILWTQQLSSNFIRIL